MLSVAIVSPNRNQYSEAFIHSQIQLLPERIHFLTDGYLPGSFSQDRRKTFFPLLPRKKWFRFAIRSEHTTKAMLIEAIEHYLVENRIDLIFCEYGPSGVEMMHIAQKLSLPLIVHFHGYDAYRKDVIDYYGPHYPDLFRIAKHIVAVSRHMYNQLILLGCNEAKLRHICYGVDTALFARSQSPETIFTLITCGRFVKKKDPLTTIKAFKKIFEKKKYVKLIMIGDGELLPEAVQLVRDYGIEAAVDFKGPLSQPEIAALYSKGFAFLQHSVTTADLDSEGTPVSIMEAMSAGLPVVTTKHGGITDLIKDDTLGFLVDEGDIDGMATKIEYLIDHPGIARETGLRGAGYIREHFDMSIYISQLSELINNCFL